MLSSFILANCVLVATSVRGTGASPQYGQGYDYQLDPDLIKEIWEDQPAGLSEAGVGVSTVNLTV